MSTIIEYVKAQSGELFDRGGLPSFWQECSDNFYPERADFTSTRSLGVDFASNLMTSYPLMMRRNTADTFSSMLRPTSKEWFNVRSRRQDKEDTAAKQFLQWLTKLQRNAMYDSRAKLNKATKLADNDFVTFGQAAMHVQTVRPKDGGVPHLLHRTYHLRDVAWQENDSDVIDTVHRQWNNATAIGLCRMFPKTVHADVKKMVDSDNKPFGTVKCLHVLMPNDIYQGFEGAKRIMQPFVSMYIDVQHDTILEEVGQWEFNYVIPRWATAFSPSQYAHSPCVVAALPDARLIQAITLVLLEAGQKAVNPPLIAVEDVIRSDIGMYAGSITWVDADYDEKMGEALRPITQDTKGLAFGVELVRDIREQMRGAFYLDKLNLPPTAGSQGGRDMTAYEVGQRVQEFIRNALPLFEPVETEYNGQLCDLDLRLLMRADSSIARMIPDSLHNQDYDFAFDSPLHDALDKVKVGQFQEAGQIIAAAQPFDQTAGYILNTKKATRDVMQAAVPADWLNTEDEVDKMAKNAQMAAQQQHLLDMMGKGGKAAKDMAAASVDANAGLETVTP